MTQRLPIPGSDNGTWGDILNGFLEVSLYNDLNNGSNPNNGTLNPGIVSDTQVATSANINPSKIAGTAETQNNKGQASGYAGLNTSGIVPAAQLGTGSASSTTYLSGNGTWSTPSATAGVSSLSLNGGSAQTGAVSISAVELGGDIGGTATSPTVSKIQGVSISAPSGGTTSYLNANGTWSTPSGSGGPTINSNNDTIVADTTTGTGVAGTTGQAADAGHQHPLVTHDHTTSNKGGQIPVGGISATGSPSTTTYLRGDGSWSTPAAGVTLDSTNTDIQALGTQSAGSSSMAAKADHVHPTTGLVTTTTSLGGDLTGTAGNATVSKIQNTAISAPTGGATSYLNANGGWTTPSTGASNATTSAPGLVQLGGDLDGSGTTATAPTLANTTNVQSVVNTIVGSNATVSGALQKTNNLSDVSDAGSSRANLHIPSLTPAACVVTTNVSSMSGLNTYDGYTTVAGDLILLTGQTTASQNGLWTAASSSWTRPTEMATGVAIKAKTVAVIQGTTYGGSTWLLKTNSSITVDTTSQTWVQQLPNSLVTSTSPPLLDSSYTSITAPFGPVTTPGPVVIASGTFTPESSTIDAYAHLKGSYLGTLAGNGVFNLYVGPTTTNPLIPTTETGTLGTGVQLFTLGSAPYLSWDGRITGLTASQTYQWSLTCSIVGYYWGLELPESGATSVSCSGFLNQLVDGSTTLAIAEQNYPAYDDVIVAISSAAHLHIIRSNHVQGLYDYLTTGSGFALPSGRTTGATAVSPNGLRVAATNYSLGTVTIYDISTPTNLASPSLVGSAVTTISNPVGICWSPDSTTIYLTQYVTSGTGQWQKITGANGSSPTAGTAQSLDTSALDMTTCQVTPDNTKLVTVSASKLYVVNTSTGSIVSSETSEIGAYCVASNTLAYVITGTSGSYSLYSVTLASGAVALIASGLAVYGTVNSLCIQPDGNSIFAFTSLVSGHSQVFQIGLTGSSAGVIFTAWGAPGSYQGANAGAGGACITPLGDFFVVSASTNTFMNIWPGGLFQGTSAAYGHQGSVRFTPAH